MTAFLNKTPLIITAGQQTREMLLSEPMLTNRDETMIARPWVKWAYQPARAEDVPAAIMRGYEIAMQAPQGPVYISIPLDDWNQPAPAKVFMKTASHRFGPDPDRIKIFAERIAKSKNPVIVFGGEIDASDAWEEAVEFAERLQCSVLGSPLNERGVFPETHAQYEGMLPLAIGPVSKRLQGHDLVIVVGAQVFKYYPFVGGEYLPDGCELLQITNDANDASSAVVGDSLLSDSKLALQALLALMPKDNRTAYSGKKAERKKPEHKEGEKLTAEGLFAILSEVRPAETVTVQESPSNFTLLFKW